MDKMKKLYEITSVSREDIKSEFGKEIAESFTEEEMIELAEKMADAWTGSGLYWVDLKIIVEYIIENRD